MIGITSKQAPVGVYIRFCHSHSIRVGSTVQGTRETGNSGSELASSRQATNPPRRIAISAISFAVSQIPRVACCTHRHTSATSLASVCIRVGSPCHSLALGYPNVEFLHSLTLRMTLSYKRYHLPSLHLIRLRLFPSVHHLPNVPTRCTGPIPSGLSSPSKCSP